jgi:hypothetical protein
VAANRFSAVVVHPIRADKREKSREKQRARFVLNTASAAHQPAVLPSPMEICENHLGFRLPPTGAKCYSSSG